MGCKTFVISYSEDGLLGKSEMLALFSDFGEVETIEFSYPRFRSNKSGLSSRLAEYVFVLERG